jgi:cytochrome c-type biogenesis protein
MRPIHIGKLILICLVVAALVQVVTGLSGPPGFAARGIRPANQSAPSRGSSAGPAAAPKAPGRARTTSRLANA